MNTLRQVISEQVLYRKQIFKLAKADIVNTYSGTLLGWSWAIIRPATFIAVYYMGFSLGLRTGAPVNGYSYLLWFLAGMIPWFFVRDAFAEGAASIRKYRYLVTKIKFPLSIIPTIECTSLLIVNMALIAILLGIFIFSGARPDRYWLQLPVYIFLMYIFFVSWSLFSSILSCLSKDFLQMVKSITIGLLWLSGIFFDPANVTNRAFAVALRLNPITFIISGFRNTLIYKKWIWEDVTGILIFLAMYVLMTFIALKVYKKMKNDIPDFL